jgi:hypothetical protein
MEEEFGYDEKTILINRALGLIFVGVGIYGLYYAYKLYKNK